MRRRDGLTVVVASPGGVGSTVLLDFLSRFVRTNDAADVDGLKHSPLPPWSWNRLKVIYVFGDPVLATVSLFRRGYHAVHSRKMQSGVWRDGPGVDWKVSLEDYAASGRDEFGFETHWRNYADNYRVWPTLLVRYEALWDHLPEVLEFAGLPPEAAPDFPKRRERGARLAGLSPALLAGLEVIHGPWQRQIASQQDVEMRGADRRIGTTVRWAGAHFFRSIRRGSRGIFPRRRPLKSDCAGCFAVAETRREVVGKLRFLGEQAGGQFVSLEGVSEGSDGVVIARRYARRTITLGDEILRARGIADESHLLKFVAVRFEICRRARAVAVLRIDGGTDFLDWIERGSL